MNVIDVDLSDLDNAELASWCDQARDDYCDAVLFGESADWQNACARSVLVTAAEARKRGIRPGSVH